MIIIVKHLKDTLLGFCGPKSNHRHSPHYRQRYQDVTQLLRGSHQTLQAASRLRVQPQRAGFHNPGVKLSEVEDQTELKEEEK